MRRHCVVVVRAFSRIASISVIAICAATGWAEAATPPAPLPDASRPILLGPYFEKFVDADGLLTIDDARSGAHGAVFERNIDEVPNLGLESAALWLRFRLADEASTADDLLLEIRYPSLDRIEFYAPELDGRGAVRYRRMVVGDTVPWRAREIQDRNYAFHLDPSAGKEFYLRVINEGPLSVPAYLWRTDAFASHTRATQLGYGVFYGLMLALILYNFMLFVSVRDPTYLYYVLYASTGSMFMLAFDGFVFEYLGPEGGWWPNNGMEMSISVSLVFGVFFVRRFLDIPRLAPWSDRLLQAIAGVMTALAVCAATGWLLSYRSIAGLNSAIGILFAVVVVILAVRATLAGKREARFLLLAWTALLTGMVVFALRNFGLIPHNFLTAYSLHIGFALDLVLLSFALGYRINVVKREAEMAKAEARAIGEREEMMRQHTLLKERQRILADMHDGLGASLVGLLRYAQTGVMDARSLELRVKDALQELRIALDALEPAEGDLATVLGKLRYRLEPLLMSAGVALKWDVGDLPRVEGLEPSAVFSIQRILLQAFTNSLQHSGARQMCLAAHASGDQGIAIRVEDDGRGIDSGQRVDGFGLGNMRARAAALGATLEIERRQGGGTCVRLGVPPRLAKAPLLSAAPEQSPVP